MPLPVVSIKQMREWEQRTWATGITESSVIERAGKAVAGYALRLTKTGDAVLVIAGRGHNGDDARVAAQNLPEREVTIIEAQEPADAIAKLKEWTAGHRPTRSLIIDGLFGIGLNRPLEGGWLELVQKLNETKIPILAVDVPSGLDAENGEPLGDAVCADVTVTMGAPKMGLLKSEAAEYVGRLEVAPDIGLIPCPFDSELSWVCPEDFDGYPPRRPDDGHKGRFGHLCIIAGSQGYHGAAVLAARGAQRAQPGLITLIVPSDVYIPVASQLRSTMVHPWQSGLWEAENFTAILCGPGLANYDLPQELKRDIQRAWQESPVPVVADASALDWLPKGPTCPDALRIITPHPGEAARMLGKKTPEILADRQAALRQLSEQWGGCYVVLKGRQTLMGNHIGRIYVNCSGNPHLAQGGAGDLLAGWLAGFAAQPMLQTDILKVIRYAVWRHGAAADELCRTNPHWTLDELEAAL